MGNFDISDLHSRIGRYLSSVDEIVIDDTVPAVIAKAPLEKGLSQFIPVDNLPDMKDLPFIPERLRDFAYRYATEYRKHATWAKEYNVSVATIAKWLSNPGVRSYIALTRLEKRFYTMARRSALENRVWTRLQEFMSIKITGDNAGAVARILEFCYNILYNPENVGGREKGTFNQAIYVDGVAPSRGDKPYAIGEDISPSPKQIKELQYRVERLKMLEMRKAAMDAEGEDDPRKGL